MLSTFSFVAGCNTVPARSLSVPGFTLDGERRDVRFTPEQEIRYTDLRHLAGQQAATIYARQVHRDNVTNPSGAYCLDGASLEKLMDIAQEGREISERPNRLPRVILEISESPKVPLEAEQTYGTPAAALALPPIECE